MSYAPPGYLRLDTNSPSPSSMTTASPPTSPRRPRRTFGPRRMLMGLSRPSPLLLFATVLALITLPVLYTHRDHPALSFNLFTPKIPSHIPPPSGGIPGLPYTLEARISNLLGRPALDQWEAELPNRHACPMYTYNRNAYFFHDDKPGQWERIGRMEIRRYRSKMVDYLRGVEREGGRLVWEPDMERDVPKDQRRGLIYTGGEGKTVERLRLSLHMLRNVVHSSIPVELYHFPDEMQDEKLRQELVSEYDVTLREVGQRRTNGKSWNIKNEAFIATQFTEFIYLDSDNIPLRDPVALFDSVEYKQSGSVFWADLNKDHPDNAIFRIMGRYCHDDHWPAEAGQIVFDKRGNHGLNLAVLHLARHMMAEPEMYSFLSYGDKDTFRFSFYALGLDYQQSTKLFASAGGYQTENGEGWDQFCGHSMIQWGLTPQSEINNPNYHPEPAFLHTILAKHRSHLQPSKLFTHIRRPVLNGINEPLLVRTLYEWTGDCFAITLKGPDGAPGFENGLGDGQGVLTLEMRDVVEREVWEALEELSVKFVSINA